ncbi:hypothetical protein KAU92_06180 [Candidatus Bathyarchaeota archaeon]|nr:hypothetical protein [Candidatus Bathyarchaeota archaeon]
MIQPRKELIVILLIVLVFSTIIQLAEATSISLLVPKGEEESKIINLTVEDRVSVKFTVVGQTGSTLDFCITDPHENVIAEYIKVGNVDYRFVCDGAGEYVLRFSNSARERTDSL